MGRVSLQTHKLFYPIIKTELFIWHLTKIQRSRLTFFSFLSLQWPLIITFHPYWFLLQPFLKSTKEHKYFYPVQRWVWALLISSLTMLAKMYSLFSKNGYPRNSNSFRNEIEGNSVRDLLFHFDCVFLHHYE